MNENATVIGEWIEAASRDVTHNHTSYAADWETLRTKPGRYPLTMTFQNLRAWPQEPVWRPYWLLAAVDATRIDGYTYNGFAGLNYSRNEEPKGAAVPLRIQTYHYYLSELVDAGKVEVLPEFQKYVDESRAFLADCARKQAWREQAAEAHKRGEPHDGAMPGDERFTYCYQCRNEADVMLHAAHRAGKPHDLEACRWRHERDGSWYAEARATGRRLGRWVTNGGEVLR